MPKKKTNKVTLRSLSGPFHGVDFDIVFPQKEEEVAAQLTEIYKYGHYEAGRVKKDAVILDIGANIGLTSLYFKDWAKMIYAVEPSSKNYIALMENTKHMDNIKCIRAGISSFSTQDFIYSTDKESTPQTFFPSGDVHYREEVRTIDMKTLFEEQGIDHVDVMKIDTEGSEYVIFPSDGFAAVADKIDLIVGEAHDITGGFPRVIPLILKEHGFDTKFIEFDKPNYLRTFMFTQPGSNAKREYKVGSHTIFVAKRK